MRTLLMIQILEIWSNDARTEYAAKISGHRFFLKTTSPDADYTHIIYAAPYIEGYMEALKEQLDQIIAAAEAKPFVETERWDTALKRPGD